MNERGTTDPVFWESSYWEESTDVCTPKVSRCGPLCRPFLRGPIPLQWLQQAATLPGKALAVSIVLWYLVGVKQKKTVTPTWKQWEMFGISRQASYRALKHLEEAGLVKIRRAHGKCPVVTVVAEELRGGE